MGGLMMTFDFDEDTGQYGSSCPGSNEADDSGWRYCGNDSSANPPYPSSSWRGHDFLAMYYTTGSTGNLESPSANNILGADQGTYLVYTYVTEDNTTGIDSIFTVASLRPYISNLSAGGGPGNQVNWKPKGLSQFFRDTLSQPDFELKAGDYVWIPTGESEPKNPKVQ
jgi:hypothetical protein